MNPSQMVEKLKEMGLCQSQRSKVMETYRDAGEEEALEQANGYVHQERVQIENAKAAANVFCGMRL
ncbi:MAG: hypothetical protein Q8P42_06220 [Gallionella sp.]|nr:hypothetical protein [Gallionella sp.]